MFPFASAGGRQLRRMNRLETKTGTTSLGAEGRTLELGIAKEEGEEAVRGTGAMRRKRAGRQNRPIRKQNGTFTEVLKEGRNTRESKETVNGIKGILEFLGIYKRVANSIYDSTAYFSSFYYS